MEEEKIKQLLADLKTEEAKILEELGEFSFESDSPGNYSSVYPEHEQDSESNAMAVQEMDRRKATEHELEKRLKEVRESMTKITAGEYGLCKTCSVEIEHERLDAIPTASLCSSCASKKGE